MFCVAQINSDNIVVAITQSPSEIIGENLVPLDSYDESIAGKRWNGESFEDVEVAVEPEVSYSLDLFDFRERFTPEEKVAIYTAAESSVQIRIWLDDLSALAQSGGMIRLDDPRTVAGVQYLEGQGLIAAGRAAEVLSISA